MAVKRADVISAKDLSTSIDRAVAAAVKRHKVKAEPSNLLINWEILGRILREYEDMNAAFNFASEVSKNVELRGFKTSPAVCRINRDILVGFIEKANLPKQFGR
jgi:hypothetical protein